MYNSYKALVIEKKSPKEYYFNLTSLFKENLPKSEVLVRVHYSSLNYKDVLSCNGNPSVTRRFPHTPGLDASGIVEQSNSKLFNVGDKVAVFCSPMGMNHSGGFAEYIYVPQSWLVKLPDTMSLKNIMVYGTAGYTAAMAVELIDNKIPKGSQVLVTGASGGLGSIACLLLKHLGYKVIASVTRKQGRGFLTKLGIEQVIDSNELLAVSSQNLLPQKWHAVIDVAGGEILSSSIKQVADNGLVVATGLVAGTHFSTNVLPFILRGITLTGINAEGTSLSHRSHVIEKLASTWCSEQLDKAYSIVRLSELVNAIKDYESKKLYGRVIIKMDDL